MRPLALAAALIALATPAPAGAQDGADYAADNPAWNGLSTFAGLVRGLGVPVVTLTRLDWDELGPGDALVILYPTQPVSAAAVAGFLMNGGRLLIGDDFGRADAALGELGMVRSAAVSVIATRYHGDDQDLPVARALAPDHPLADGVSELTTNHPALFTEIGGPTAVFGFADHEVVVVAGERGSGRFVALADPSLLINRMLELEGNFAFARNAIEHLVDPTQGGRVIILTGSFALSGAPSRALSGDQGLTGRLIRINRWLDELNLWYLHDGGLKLVCVLIAAGAALLAFRALPMAKRGALDGSWTRVAGAAASLPATSLVAALDAPRRGQDYVVPAAVVRDEVNRRLAALIGGDEPLTQLSATELRRRVEAAVGAAVASEVAALAAALAGLPSRAQAASPWQSRPLGRRDFDRIATAAAKVYRSLDAAGQAGTRQES